MKTYLTKTKNDLIPLADKETTRREVAFNITLRMVKIVADYDARSEISILEI